MEMVQGKTKSKTSQQKWSKRRLIFCDGKSLRETIQIPFPENKTQLAWNVSFATFFFWKKSKTHTKMSRFSFILFHFFSMLFLYRPSCFFITLVFANSPQKTQLTNFTRNENPSGEIQNYQTQNWSRLFTKNKTNKIQMYIQVRPLFVSIYLYEVLQQLAISKW